MTREQQVKAALELLTLGRPGRHDACRDSIENALDIMALGRRAHDVFNAARSKAARQAERKVHQTLRRLQRDLKELLAVGGGYPADLTLNLDHIEHVIRSTKPQRYNVRYRSVTLKPALAVALAHQLIVEQWGSDEFISRTRTGSWWRLSAILYGQTIDLRRHLYAFRRGEIGPFRLTGPRPPRQSPAALLKWAILTQARSK